MRARVQNGWLLGAVMLLALPATAQTPAPDAKSPPAPAATSAAPTPAVPATDPLAFPEEDSKTKSLGEEPAPAAPDVPAAPAPSAPAPAAPVPTAPAPAAADSHPYPGDAAPGAVPDNGGFSSSSDNAAGSPDAGTLPDATVPKKLELHDEGSTGHIDTARADKDYQVADFYIKDGNYAGAYLRYKDAVTYDPDNADAHFRLAEMARKTGKTAEAIEQFNVMLKLDPQSKDAKAARKALAELQSAAKK